MRFAASILFLTCLLPVQAVSGDPRPRANEEQVQRALDVIRVEHNVPGMAVAIFDRDEVRVYTAGQRNADAARVETVTRFRIGQTGGLLTALTVLQLDAEGTLPLDMPVRRLAPELDIRNPWPDMPVTLRHLLTHSGGVTPPHFRDVFVTSPPPLLAAINRAFRSLDIAFRPGTETRYSLAGYGVAAYAAERAAEAPYENLLETLLISPLELSIGYEEIPQDAQGFDGRRKRVNELLPNFLAVAGLYASVEDLAKIGRLLLNGGMHDGQRILSRDVVAALLTDAEVPRSPQWRPGLKTVERDGFLFYEQSGALPGFLSLLAVSPSLEHGFVILLNRGDAEAALAEAAQLMRGQIVAGHQPPPRPPAYGKSLSEELTGFWQRRGWQTPQERYWSEWLDIAHARKTGRGELVLQAVLGSSLKLQAMNDDGVLLREQGAWYPGWELQKTSAGDLELRQLDKRWRKLAHDRVIGGLLLAVLSLAGLLAGIVSLPVLLAGIAKGENRNYHQWLPRLLPGVAAWLFVLWQWRLFALGYPALGEVSAGSVTVLVLSLLFPLAALAAIFASLAGLRWGISRGATLLNVVVSAAALIAAAWMIPAGLIAFQSWNF